jgi:hypothetical protein
VFVEMLRAAGEPCLTIPAKHLDAMNAVPRQSKAGFLKIDHALEFNLVLCCRNTGKASINGVAVRQENYTGVCGNSQEGDDHSEFRRYGDIWNRELGVL